MKKYILYYILMGAGALLGTACSKSETLLEPASDNEIAFRISKTGPATKVTESGFQIGDEIGLWAVERSGGNKVPLQIGGNFINNEALRLQDAQNHWAGSRTLYWSETACDFYGVFPYQSDLVSVEAQPFSVRLDQSVAANYTASDLLWACAENVSHGQTVDLQFRHLLSKLNVIIVEGDKFEGDIPVDIALHVYNTTTSGKVNLQEGSIEKDPFGAKGTITAKKVSDHLFEAIVVPQFIEKKTPLIEVTMGGIAYLLEYSISFRPGYEHTIRLTVNTSPDQEMIEISIDADPGNWS